MSEGFALLGPNVGSAWVSLRFSAKGSSKEIQDELKKEGVTDKGDSGLGAQVGAKIGQDISKGIGKNTSLKPAADKIKGESSDIEKSFKGIKGASEDAGRSASDLGRNIGSLSNLAMPALISAGVALSPVIATLATGVGGLGIAAAGIIKPITDAASKTGGLKANLAGLSPEARTVAQGVLGLQKEFTSFEKVLDPTLLPIFSQGLKIAGNVLKDIEPVSIATGKSIAGLVAEFGSTLQNSQWQKFWAFMATTAPQDMNLLGQTLVDVTGDLPNLLMALQPVGTGLLTAADDAAKAAGQVGNFYQSFQKNVPISTEHTFSFFRDLDKWTVDITNKIPGLKHVNDAITGVQHAVNGSSAAQSKAIPVVQTLAAQAESLAKALTGVNTAESKTLGLANKYAESLVTSATDATGLAKALKQSHDRIGLNTAAQRASFGAANTYVNDLSSQASAAVAAGKGVGGAIRAIRNGFPILESAKTKNRAYWQEVKTLHDWLVKLQNLRQIKESVSISGTGHWTVISPGHGLGLPGGTAGGPFAAGGMVRGGTPGKDSVIARVMPGELIVPTKMVNAGLVDHLRGLLPGFAAGGQVGYQGPLSGLLGASERGWSATVRGIVSGAASEMASQFKKAITSAPIGGHFGAGVAQWRGLVLKALGMEGLSPLLAGRVLYQMQTESGGNPNAINLTDSNAAAGDPSRGLMQTIGATFSAYHWPGTSSNIYNPLANIAAALNYARHRYGPSLMSGGMGIGSGHGYDSGGVAKGLGFLPKYTPKPERVLSPQQTSAFERLVDELDGRAAARGPREMRITGGKVEFDPRKGELWMRDIAMQESDAQITFRNGR